jgi:hypothetical protein
MCSAWSPPCASRDRCAGACRLVLRQIGWRVAAARDQGKANVLILDVQLLVMAATCALVSWHCWRAVPQESMASVCGMDFRARSYVPFAPTMHLIVLMCQSLLNAGW